MAMATTTAPTDAPEAVFGRGMRLVIAHIRSNPRPFWISVVGAFVFGGASVLFTVALGHVTDRVVRPAFGWGGVPAGKLWLAVGVLMLFAGLRALGIGVRRYYSGVLGAAVGATLRERVSDRYRALALGYYRQQPTGELLAHMEADVEAATEILYPIPFSVGAICLVVFALVSLVAADPFLALVGMVMIPALVQMNRSF